MKFAAAAAAMLRSSCLQSSQLRTPSPPPSSLLSMSSIQSKDAVYCSCSKEFAAHPWRYLHPAAAYSTAENLHVATETGKVLLQKLRNISANKQLSSKKVSCWHQHVGWHAWSCCWSCRSCCIVACVVLPLSRPCCTCSRRAGQVTCAAVCCPLRHRQLA